MPAAITIGPLSAAHRSRVEEIVRGTGVFSEDEVEVALELFDEGMNRDSGLGTRHSASAPSPDGRVPSPTHPSTSSYLFLGAFTPEDELVGYACYGATPGTDATWDLYWIAVDPAAQHGGVGTLLLHEVERRLLGHHARMLVVETSSRSDYAPTRGFYGRRGYAETARVREFYAPGDDRIILTKRFHSPRAGVGVASP